MSHSTVRELMSGTVLTVKADATVYEAAQLMRRHNVGFIPVLDGEQIVGIVTDRDLVLRVLAEQKAYDIAVRKIMSPPDQTIDLHASADDAAHQMANAEVRRLLVMDQGKLAGVIALGDLSVNASTKTEAGEALQEISRK